MHIHSLNTVYTIIKQINGSNDRLVARDGKGNLRLLAFQRSASGAKRLMPCLLDWKDNEAFTDFIEFFPYNDGLVAVFAYYDDGIYLDNALDEADYLMRATVLRSLFGLVLSQDLPPEIISEALSEENLLVTASGKARLLYALPDGGTATLADAARRITGAKSDEDYDMFNSIFIENLSGGSMDYREMYEQADEAAASLEGYTPKLRVKKTLTIGKLKERLTEIADALLARWAIIFAALVVVIGCFAVGVLFYNTVINPSVVDNGIKSIGTVVISDDR